MLLMFFYDLEKKDGSFLRREHEKSPEPALDAKHPSANDTLDPFFPVHDDVVARAENQQEEYREIYIF
jgi:hypothetical protein